MKNKISLIRKAQKLTQAQLATLVGFPNYQSLQAIESEKNIPSVETALRLARALNTTVEELFILED